VVATSPGLGPPAVAPILPLPVSEISPDLSNLVPGGLADTTGVPTGRVDRFTDVPRQRFGQSPKVFGHSADLVIGRHGMSL
jgi:hypothetical protein